MQMTVDSDLSFSHSLKGFVLVLRARGNTWTRIQMMFWSNRTAALTAQNMQINFETLSIQKFLLKRNFEGLIITFWRSIVSDRKEEESKKISFETMRHFPHDSCMEFRWLSFPVSLSHSCWAKKKSHHHMSGQSGSSGFLSWFLNLSFWKKSFHQFKTDENSQKIYLKRKSRFENIFSQQGMKPVWSHIKVTFLLMSWDTFSSINGQESPEHHFLLFV